MRRLLFFLLPVCLFPAAPVPIAPVPASLAQQPPVPGGLPQFPLPRDFTPTPQDLGVSGALLNAVRARFECKKCNGQEPGGRVGATMLKLGELGAAALVTSYAADHCNDNGNCAIWLFPAQGEPRELDWGVSYAVVTTATKPVPDIAIRGMSGPRNEFVHLFSYVNGHYAATGCLSLYDKNEMGDVTISACK
jgi:hypothetical protein